VGDVDRLNMLYLLTVADSRATGPGALNRWKHSLLRDLRAKVHRVLTRSGLAARELAARTDRLLLDVTQKLLDRLPPDEVDAHLEKMSAHYLSVMTADEVIRHILLERRLGDSPVLVDVRAVEGGLREAVIVTRDRPGLLSQLAGAFTLHHVNIWGAQVFTRANDVVLDIFQVDRPLDQEMEDESWSRFEKDCREILTGRLDLEEALAKKQPLMGRQMPVTTQPDRVVVDNETSDFYTIIEVYTYDRLGLLHNLTKTLFDRGLSINVAKISTKVEQVVDVFYVRDFDGQKVYNAEKLDEIRDALMAALTH
jgi:[protein-PII] uridylyltransferase